MNVKPTRNAVVGPPLLAIGLLSATALGYEILLMRLFSIIQWHHFAYMIISLALLGYGASGTFLAFVQSTLLKRYPLALIGNLALFAASAMPCFLLAQKVPFNPEEILWNWREPLQLVFIYLVLSLPFFFAANAIALTLVKFSRVIPRVYAVDLFGAGAGSLGVILLLYLVPPMAALTIVSLLGLVSMLVAAVELRMSGGYLPVSAVALLLGIMIWALAGEPLSLSPYKGLSQALRVSGASIIDERNSPLATLHVLENQKIPLRHAPGLSINSPKGPPGQLGLFSDGNSVGVITRDAGDASDFDYLDQLVSALPYHLKPFYKVLVLGAGGGEEVLQARYQNAQQIHVVELNPQLLELVKNDYADYTGQLYSQPGIHLHAEEGRGFVAASRERYDLIQLALPDASGAGSGGLFSLSEDYLHTSEAMRIYLEHLNPGGFLAISQWIELPPRQALKLFATVIDVLERLGVQAAGNRMVLIRGWQTSTLLIKNGAFTHDEISALQAFCASRSFDVAWYPGMSADEPNRFNRLREAYYYAGVQQLLGPAARSFMDHYKFKLRPATDDQPYFYNFFKWSTLPEILKLRGQGGLPLLEAGYPVLVATLAQALLASLLLVLLPLVFLNRRRRSRAVARISRYRVLVYFFAIGMAFLFIEIAFMQKFTLFLHHPLLSASVVLASFLVFAGLGSNWSGRLASADIPGRGIGLATGGILLTAILYLLLLDSLFGWLIAWSTIARVVASILLIAPLAFFMGMPFPLALTRLGEGNEHLIPLAWGVNGCASVLSAVLATLLAIQFGFTAVIVLALIFYVVAMLSFPQSRST